MQIFDALGATIEAAFRQVDYDEEQFPAIAARALRDAKISEQITLSDVLRWLLSSDALPEQEDIEADFGEPPITVHRGRRFHIQVLVWLTGSTSIHEHGFAGAFQVLEGSSVQSWYELHAPRRINSRLTLGEVRLRGVDLLVRGDVVELHRGLAHSVFHLDAPSATVVVRTYTDPDKQPQYEYLPPSVAYDPFFMEPLVMRWLQALAAMIRAKHPDYQALASSIVERCDLHTCLLVLAQAHRRLHDLARIQPIVEAAERRHGAAIAEITAALRVDLLRRKIFRLRSAVKEPEPRLFLALLQNLPDRAAIDAVLRRRYPEGELRARVISLAHALSGVDRIGVDFEDDLNRALFEALLDGGSEAEILDRLKVEFNPAQVDAQAEAIRRFAGRMRATALGPLFRRA